MAAEAWWSWYCTAVVDLESAERIIHGVFGPGGLTSTHTCRSAKTCHVHRCSSFPLIHGDVLIPSTTNPPAAAPYMNSLPVTAALPALYLIDFPHRLSKVYSLLHLPNCCAAGGTSISTR